MCTLTFYKDHQKVIFTSNRDEKLERAAAVSIEKKILSNQTIFYPEDPKHKGTWFVVSNSGNVLVLLNGAKNKHISSPPYRKSRGLILIEIADSEHVIQKWKQINLLNIEPFTIIVYFNHQLFQLIWDGNTKKRLQLNENQAHIWSSSTLYEKEIIIERKKWFKDWMFQIKKPLNSIDFYDFHTNTQKNDLTNGLIINRNNMMATKNITQCILENNAFQLIHNELISHLRTEVSEPLK